MDDEGEWLGVGLYTAAEGARLLDLPAVRVRRWLDGYRAAGREHPRLWQPQLPKLDDQIGLGFLDLMQLRLVHRIVTKTDISLQAMRKAIVLAQDLLRHTHPFTTAQFRTDGRRLFLEIGREADEPGVYDVLGRQYGFHRIIEPSFTDVDLNVSEIARWWPLGHRRTVVVDPLRAFGAPIAASSGIPTATLASAAEREGSPRKVMRWYPVTEREVRDAIAFERRLSGAPARQLAA